MTEDVFGEIEDTIETNEQDESNEGQGKRQKAKYYVCEVVQCLGGVKELREYLENNDSEVQGKSIIKGSELEVKRKVVYAI